MAAPEPKSIPEVMSELKELTVTYAKQETVDPLKSLTRFVAWGLPGKLLQAIGFSLLALALLRALQTETGTVFASTWSFVPYLIVAVFLMVIGFRWYLKMMQEAREAKKRREAEA